MAYPFIVVEGIDGAGKAAQIEELKKMAKKRRERIFVHKFPTETARDVHKHLEREIELDEEKLFEAYLTDIARMQEEIRRNLGLGWVVCDRYAISTVAYQSVKAPIEKRIAQVEAQGLLKPDKIIWIDVPVEIAMGRKAAQKTPDRHEADREFLGKVAENYLELYRKSFMCEDWTRIDGNAPVQTVAKRVRESFDKGMNTADF